MRAAPVASHPFQVLEDQLLASAEVRVALLARSQVEWLDLQRVAAQPVAERPKARLATRALLARAGLRRRRCRST